MHGDVNGEGSRAFTPDDVLVLVVTFVGVALLACVFIWGIRDADREARVRLIADTRAPQILDVGAGRYSASAEEEFAAYYPALVRAHPGDTIRFTNPTIEDPHSVTFGLKRDRSNQPRFGTGDALPNINGACVSEMLLTPLTTTCDGIDDLAHAPAFNGQPYFNSGIIPPGGGVFDLRLADTLETGSYEFGCVIHPAQVGTLEVVDPGEPTQRPGQLDESAQDGFDDDVADLRAVRRQAHRRADPVSGGPDVQAGIATARASLNVFLPDEVTIDAGQAITWANTGSVPHVMIFGGVLSPQEATETPPTEPSGSSLPEGLFTTGPIGALPYPRSSFTVRFDDSGSYSYACTFHPGMTGTVIVR